MTGQGTGEASLGQPGASGRGRSAIAVTVVLALSALAIVAATRYSRGNPAIATLPPGITIGDDSITLSKGVPQWNVLRVGTARAAQVHWTDAVTARVRIDEKYAARVGSPLAGRVAEVFVELGQPVKKGQPLFRVMSTDIAELRSDAAKAAADLDVAKVEYARVHDMVQLRLLPGKDDLSAEAKRRQAELSLRGVQARIGALRVAASTDNEFTVVAPRRGIVVEKNLLPAQEIGTDGTLIQIAEIAEVWVVADVFESDAAGITAGTPARITLPSVPGFSAEVAVESVSAVVDPVKHSVLVKARLANPSGSLRPNEYADMRFRVPVPAAAVEVAATSVVSDGATEYVYVEDAPGHFVRRKIAAGPVRDGNVLVYGGLRLGEKVVEEGGILLENQIDIAH